MHAEFELMETIAKQLKTVTQERDHYRTRCHEQEIQISELLRELSTDEVVKRNQEWLVKYGTP